MTERTAVLISGSRDWTDYEAIRGRLAVYSPNCNAGGAILIHGDCGKPAGVGTSARWRGADKIAGYIASQRGFIVWRLPYFADLGKRGGPERNACMVMLLDQLRRSGFRCFVEGFPIGRSPGTRGCLKLAETAVASHRVHEPEVEWFSIHVTEGR